MFNLHKNVSNMST